MDGNIEKMQSLTGRIKGLGIDKTLTKKGMCAEAEATGKALATKVSITDIVDDLLSVATDKPLSANQGRILKKLIDEIDPHYAENVLYNDTNVKDALDKVSKAENIAYDSEKSVQVAMDEVSRTLGYTMSKNLLRYPYFMDKNIANGITWTVNGDGSVTPSGTSTDESNTVLQHRLDNALKLKKGKYILSGCPKGGNTDTYSLLVLKTVGDSYEIVAQDVGEGVEFELTEDTNVGVLCKVWKSGVTLNENHTYYPMINDARLGKIPFEQYVKDVQTQINTVQTQLNTIFTSVAYTIQTTSNSSASPYTRYGDLDISSHINAYGTPISINASNSSGIPVPCSFSTGSKRIKVCSNLGEIYTKVVYVKIPVTEK